MAGKDGFSGGFVVDEVDGDGFGGSIVICLCVFTRGLGRKELGCWVGLDVVV